MDKLTLRAYMTGSPHTIGGEQSLKTASELMRQFHIRHLPVLSRGVLVGILSDRDIKLVEALDRIDPAEVRVEEAMTPEPFAVSSETSLEWVAMEMARQKYGSAVIVDNKKVVGVFTTVDALRALEGLLGRSRRRRRSVPALELARR